MNKLNVFFHINLNNNSAGGIINFLREMLIILDEKLEIDYYTMKYSEVFKIKDLNVNQIFLKDMKKDPNKKKIIPHNLTYLWRLFLLMGKKKFPKNDILLFNRTDNTLPAILFQKNSKKILIIHGSTNIGEAYKKSSVIKRTYSKFVETLAIKNFNKIIFVSHDDLYFYEKEYPKYKSKFLWIPTFVDPNIFKIDKNIKVSNNQKDLIHYIYFGRFVEQKGMKILFNYLKYLDSNKIKYKMTLIGEGNLKYLFEEMENVEIIDTISQNEIVDYLKSKVILIMLSRWEGMPLTLIEALTTGTPAICSKAGEMKYIIKDGYNGYSFDINNKSYESIYKVSLEIWENYSYFSSKSQESISDFMMDNVVKEYEKLFLEI